MKNKELKKKIKEILGYPDDTPALVKLAFDLDNLQKPDYPRKKRITFRARRIVKIPVRVKFRTFDGRKVSFKATKAIRRPTRVSFLARRKRKWY